MNRLGSNYLEVKLLRHKCIGCAYCTSIAPEIFSISPIDGKVAQRGEEITDSDTITFYSSYDYLIPVEQSVKICPVDAIVVKK